MVVLSFSRMDARKPLSLLLIRSGTVNEEGIKTEHKGERLVASSPGAEFDNGAMDNMVNPIKKLRGRLILLFFVTFFCWLKSVFIFYFPHYEGIRDYLEKYTFSYFMTISVLGCFSLSLVWLKMIKNS